MLDHQNFVAASRMHARPVLASLCRAACLLLCMSVPQMLLGSDSSNGQVLCFSNIHAMVSAELSYKSTGSFQIEFDDDKLRVLAPSFLDELLEEFRSPDFRNLVAAVTNDSDAQFPQFEILMLKMIGMNSAEPLMKCKDKKTAGDLRFRFLVFVDARRDGHTAKYAYDALRELGSTNFTLPEGFPIDLKNRYSIPSQWIQKYRPGNMDQAADPAGIATLSTPDRPDWLVFDGKFAWIYYPMGLRERVDAQDYDPKLKPQFVAAWNEANDIVRSPGRSIPPIFYGELQRILRQKYGISWYTPEELEEFERRY